MTQTDIQFQQAIASARTDEHMDPKKVADKIAEIDAHLAPYFTAKVERGLASEHPDLLPDDTEWRLEGWTIDPDASSDSIWPITARLYFRHTRLIGNEAAVAWGLTGSNDCLAWLEEVGFPMDEVALVME